MKITINNSEYNNNEIKKFYSEIYETFTNVEEEVILNNKKDVKRILTYKLKVPSLKDIFLSEIEDKIKYGDLSINHYELSKLVTKDGEPFVIDLDFDVIYDINK